jgi:replicative DNA helicase
MAIKIIDAIMGAGKAQTLDSLLLSKEGFIQMKNIKLNMQIYGEDGELHSVVGVYPQGIKDVYEVVFSDGSKVKCCKEHLWTYQKPYDKIKGIYRTESL